jgi:hypothetical protein
MLQLELASHINGNPNVWPFIVAPRYHMNATTLTPPPVHLYEAVYSRGRVLYEMLLLLRESGTLACGLFV